MLKGIVMITLDGPEQYTLLILALAAVSYIRTVPYAKLVAKIDEIKSGSAIPKLILVQVIVLDLMQLAFVAIGVLLIGRNLIWHNTYDALILWSYFGLVCVFMLFHLVINIRGIFLAFSSWSKKP